MRDDWSTLKKLIWLHTVLGGSGGSGIVTTVTGVSPLSLVNAVAGSISRLVQTGKCIQNGTPTPSEPVNIVCNNGAVKWRASGTNLLDMTEGNIRLRYYINDSGVESSNNQNFYNTKFIPVKPNTTYTLSVSEPVYYSSIMEYDSNKGFLQRTLDGNANEKHESMTFTTIADTAYILIGSNPNRAALSMDDVTSIDWMLNEGSIALPYEPYTEGIIADGTPEVISVGSYTASVQNLFAIGDYVDTQDIISGTVSRQVGVKVLDGTEDWGKLSSYNSYYIVIDDMKFCNPAINGVSSHFVGTNVSNSTMPDLSIKNAFLYSGGQGAIIIRYNSIANVDDFKAFLAAQYNLGTPVIILYPLTEEIIETVPGQTLRTAKGTNTVSVVSNVDPINLEVAYLKAAE